MRETGSNEKDQGVGWGRVRDSKSNICSGAGNCFLAIEKLCVYLNSQLILQACEIV